MNITFLVGNGFDIAAGLKTDYKSFYEWYCALPSDKDSPDVKSFKQSIHEYIERVHRHEDLENDTWADFELGLGAYTSVFSKETGNNFLQCRENAFTQMIEYLKLEQDKFDIESLSDNDIARIRKQLGQFYKDLLPNEAQKIANVFHSNRNENSTIKLLSFNYTNVLDQVVEKISGDDISTWVYASTKKTYRIDPSVLHIHGKLNEYPILALNDETQIENKDLLSTIGFRESMIKSIGVQAMGRDWYAAATNIINNSRIICILGMSLGATDRTWWEKIATWLNNDNSRILIVYQHLNTPINNISIPQYVINKNRVITKLLSYSGLPAEKKQQLAGRIYVAFNAPHVLQLKDASAIPALV